MTEAMEGEKQHDDHHPKGTWMVMGLMLLVIVALWVTVYGMLLTRG